MAAVDCLALIDSLTLTVPFSVGIENHISFSHTLVCVCLPHTNGYETHPEMTNHRNSAYNELAVTAAAMRSLHSAHFVSGEHFSSAHICFISLFFFVVVGNLPKTDSNTMSMGANKGNVANSGGVLCNTMTRNIYIVVVCIGVAGKMGK